jgi:hypothetical protein
MKVIPTEEIEWGTVVANARQFAPDHAGREDAG